MTRATPFLRPCAPLRRQPAAAAGAMASLAVAAALLLADAASAQADDAVRWPVVGRQGIVQIVVVPQASVTDAAAYQAQIARLCPAGQTCFINFHANPQGAALELPLAESIAAAATARFRRSAKNGVEVLQWSCRLGLMAGECF